MKILNYTEEGELRMKLMMLRTGFDEEHAIAFLVNMGLDVYDVYFGSASEHTVLWVKKEDVTRKIEQMKQQ